MAAAGMFVRRMKRELELLRGTASPPGVVAWPADESRMDRIEGELTGASETPYEGGIFRVEVYLPPEYPLKPPAVRFLTKIYHPNIDTEGRICLDTLNMPPKGAWKPSLNISTVLTSILALMSAPNPDDALMADISDIFRRDRPMFERIAKEWTAKHATPKSDSDKATQTTAHVVGAKDNDNNIEKKQNSGPASEAKETSPTEIVPAQPTPKKRSRLSRKSSVQVTPKIAPARIQNNATINPTQKKQSPPESSNPSSGSPSPDIDIEHEKLPIDSSSPPAISIEAKRPVGSSSGRRTREILVEDSDLEEEEDEVVVVSETKLDAAHRDRKKNCSILIEDVDNEQPAVGKQAMTKKNKRSVQAKEQAREENHVSTRSQKKNSVEPPATPSPKKKSPIGGRLKRKRRRQI